MTRPKLSTVAWRWIAVAIAIAAAGAPATYVEAQAAGGAAEADPSRWEKAIRAFEAWDAQNSPPDHPVLFIGSSSIRMWSTHEDFPELPVVNRGFGGAQISDVNAFASRIVAPYDPRVVVVYCGDNDIKAGKTPQRIVDDFRIFVSFVRNRTTAGRVIYLPIKPSLSRWELWEKMQEVNEAILEESETNDRLFYADVATPMLGPEGGKPDPELFLEDGLHLSGKGYTLWVAALRPVLEEVLATEP